MTAYNIYCDESCHLEHDGAKAMVMGAISCPQIDKERVYTEIREIKKKYGLSTWAEIKWTRVSASKLPFYIELIRYFINEPCLSFRAVVVKDKSNLNHGKYNNGSHEIWYFKTYFYLLDAMISYNDTYRVFIDIKDTCGGPKIKKLHEVLCNNIYDFKQDVIKGIYQIKSNESEILQLTDLIMGAISFYHNDHYGIKESSNAKIAILDELFKDYKSSIINGTSRGTKKMDIFLWRLER
ncbi:MAG: DUF3800 domain-containing protein [Bacillota bacterium]|nr:DUF3800 domain-containing protein [Bacillota bacterium]